MKKKKKDNSTGSCHILFRPIYRRGIVFCLLTLLVILLGSIGLSVIWLKSTAETSMAGAHAQISQRVNEAVTLLESLAGLPEFYDPEVDAIEKVKKLDQMSPHFGYLMICYVDADITVYSDGSEPASLASRDYMQRLFSTGEYQVTDSFAAGADGVTLNYTVAVPLFDPEENLTGCLFCAIYFDEVTEILEEAAGMNSLELTLIGSKGQIMSSTEGLAYGEPVMNELKSRKLIGTTADKLQERLLAAEPGNYWNIHNGSLCYTTYRRVNNTGWDILCTVSLWTIFSEILPLLAVILTLVMLLSILNHLVLWRHLVKDMKMVDILVQSLEELERKIYQDERPEDVDFDEIIRLTGNGLSDSLTGVVTRSVFVNQASAALKKADASLTCALCFVDMDNLKHINDTYGHKKGDIALKSVGYILREYEKKYDGVVGRYGGDEFVMLLIALDDEEELRGVLDELVLRLHSEIGSGGEYIPVQCSIGVAVYHPGADLEQLIADADEALYFVKQNGKGYYKIHRN